jgi:hypothetical protein
LVYVFHQYTWPMLRLLSVDCVYTRRPNAG